MGEIATGASRRYATEARIRIAMISAILFMSDMRSRVNLRIRLASRAGEDACDPSMSDQVLFMSDMLACRVLTNRPVYRTTTRRAHIGHYSPLAALLFDLAFQLDH